MNRNSVIVSLLVALACAVASADLADLVQENIGRQPHRGPAPLMPFQIPLDPNPYWTADTQVGSIWSTGLLDVANDGYPDVVTVHESGKCYVYKNNDGDVETTPSWESNDQGANIWAAFGDYDNDGDLDMAVSCYQFVGGRTKVYDNLGGSLDPDPSWIALAGGGTICDWGDVDNDGDLDLAIVDMFARPGVFINDTNGLSPAPLWRGTDYDLDYAVAWLDVENDGDLDLAVSGVNPNVPALRVYTNTNGTLETTASWSSTHNAGDFLGAYLSVHDVNGDGWLDVGLSTGFVSTHNNCIYMNRNGMLESSPSWISSDAATSGAGRFGDMDEDGDLDWAVNNGVAGVVYENLDTILALNTAWQSNRQGGLGMDIADMDGDGITLVRDTFAVTGAKRLFYFRRGPVQTWGGAFVNGIPLADSQYCWNPMRGWVSIGDSLATGDTVVCEYWYSGDLEFLLSDYPGDRAHLFLNEPAAISDRPTRPALRVLRVSPSPFTNSARVLSGPTGRVSVHDPSGRLLQTVCRTTIGPSLSPGVYFVSAEGFRPTRVTKLDR